MDLTGKKLLTGGHETVRRDDGGSRSPSPTFHPRAASPAERGHPRAFSPMEQVPHSRVASPVELGGSNPFEDTTFKQALVLHTNVSGWPSDLYLQASYVPLTGSYIPTAKKVSFFAKWRWSVFCAFGRS